MGRGGRSVRLPARVGCARVDRHFTLEASRRAERRRGIRPRLLGPHEPRAAPSRGRGVHGAARERPCRLPPRASVAARPGGERRHIGWPRAESVWRAAAAAATSTGAAFASAAAAAAATAAGRRSGCHPAAVDVRARRIAGAAAVPATRGGETLGGGRWGRIGRAVHVYWPAAATLGCRTAAATSVPSAGTTGPSAVPPV
mmetsp:Transcript_45296/g.150149  ORF Transcript_45296/g.150149 Transcript_45296/m.150149 type:complete len:200 (-) Transcript_45296:159-758(-)